ncbi:cytidine deaminase-like protein, partial [Mycena leptocephala]
SVIVNHTVPGLGELVCTGGNTKGQTGDPTLHGEIAAIRNCSAILTDPSGPYKLSPAEALDAFTQLSLYTNAESCSMCASAIRWAGFREYIYGTSIETLVQQGWGQIRIPSLEVFKRSFELPDPARLIGEVLTNETDPYLVWQFNPNYPCPVGCARSGNSTSCTPIKV